MNETIQLEEELKIIESKKIQKNAKDNALEENEQKNLIREIKNIKNIKVHHKEKFYRMRKQYKIYNQDCVEALKKLEDNSIDSIITDPPYGLGFMGKEWDSLPPSKEVFEQCYRVLKPGGYLLSFGGTRTYHRMAVAIEDAGFEIRDMIEWIYGSGFPKSLNVEKAINKMDGVKFDERPASGEDFMNDSDDGYNTTKNQLIQSGESSERAKQFKGWGTALKPAHEPICMARKLFRSSVAENVLKWGTGGINIDESRVETIEDLTQRSKYKDKKSTFNSSAEKRIVIEQPQGRFPSNLIHDNSEEVRECFPNESERFFKSIIYQGKASKSERNKGCEGLENSIGGGMAGTQNQTLLTGSGNIRNNITKNNHPTVKPIALMEYLIKMVTPEDGVVLDPFAGSGTTGVAALQNGYKFIGIEKESDYIPIIEARLQSECKWKK